MSFPSRVVSAAHYSFWLFVHFAFARYIQNDAKGDGRSSFGALCAALIHSYRRLTFAGLFQYH